MSDELHASQFTIDRSDNGRIHRYPKDEPPGDQIHYIELTATADPFGENEIEIDFMVKVTSSIDPNNQEIEIEFDHHSEFELNYPMLIDDDRTAMPYIASDVATSKFLESTLFADQIMLVQIKKIAVVIIEQIIATNDLATL